MVDYEPITVTDLIAASDNSANSSYAKVGDEIKLTFTPDATIETVTGDILGDENFTFSERRGVITLSKIINQNDTNGNLTFDIFVSNSSGYAARITLSPRFPAASGSAMSKRAHHGIIQRAASCNGVIGYIVWIPI